MNMENTTQNITRQPLAMHKWEINKRILSGRLFSNKGDKTIIVAIVRQVAHPLYKKYYKRTKQVMAHDPLNECKEGDIVR
jgi:small subunit ribosomal protein S17